jgi:proteasome activator subunit 4
MKKVRLSGFENTPPVFRDALVKESKRLLDYIKVNLRTGMEEGDPKFVMECLKLFKKYISTLKYPLENEDRRYLARLILDYMVQTEHQKEELPLMLHTLKLLLKEDDIEDLVIQWRPLYELSIRLFIQDHYTWDVENTFAEDSVENSFTLFIEKAHPYFPDSATDEILQELTPRLYPGDGIYKEVGNMLNMFLPNKFCAKWMPLCIAQLRAHLSDWSLVSI